MSTPIPYCRRCSAQATDVGVNKATGPFKVADTPQKMLALGEAKVPLHSHHRFVQRQRKTYRPIATFVDDHDGAVPTDRESLESCPVAANRQCSAQHGLRTAHHRRRHPHRVANRTGMGAGKPLAVEKAFERRIPAHWKNHAHHWLIHGRYICKARKPACPECSVDDLCRFKDKTRLKGSAPATTPATGRCCHPAPTRRARLNI